LRPWRSWEWHAAQIPDLGITLMRIKIIPVLFSAALWCEPISAAAQTTAGAGLGLQLGYHSDYQRASLVYETPSLWTHQFRNDWGKVDLQVALGVSYWHSTRYDATSMGQIGAIPVVRWWPNEYFFVEIGSGPTLFSRNKFANHRLSTHFQFGSRIGMGMATKHGQVGIHYAHYSNANIRKPNPGLDLLEVMAIYRF